jgi:U3 small nucleolar RNA-associated protein 13
MKKEKNIFCISEENNFFFYNYENFEEKKHILGFNDEIVDVAYLGKKLQKIVIATNNDRLTVFDIETKNTNILQGHKDIVLTVACSSDSKYFMSGGKDDTVRIWEVDKLRCIAIGDTHAGPVTSLCVAPNNEFFCSVSDDKTLKLWKFDLIEKHSKKHQKTKTELEEKDILPILGETCIAHSKDITQVSVSPDSQMIATSSTDKSVKIWTRDLKMKSEFKHKSAVWCVSFSNVEKCIATGSNDKLIRIWSLASGTCIKVLEGHTKAVMKIKYINNGTQLLSVGADGLTKIWSLKTNNCEATFDEHTERIWSMDVRKDGEEFITGGEDSKIILWKENTQVVIQEEQKVLDEEMMKDQKIKNLVRSKKFTEAVLEAITLQRPKLLFDMIQKVEDLDTVIQQLNHEQMIQLFQYSIDWNTNSRFSDVSQKILFSLLKQVDPSFVSFSYEKSVDSLIAYSKRHLKRIENILERSYYMDFLLANMNLLLPSNEEIESQNHLNSLKVENVEKIQFVTKKNEDTLMVEQMIQDSFQNQNEIIPEPPKKKLKVK